MTRADSPAPKPTSAAEAPRCVEASPSLQRSSGAALPLPLLFLGHGFCSVSLTLMNKSIAMDFMYTWTVVFLQNISTLLIVPLLHVLGMHKIQPLPRASWLPVMVNAVWLVLVLWSSIKTMQFISVPLYVVIRNTVPFQTMMAEYIGLGRPVRAVQVLALGVTFSGTLLYTTGDKTGDWEGLGYAFSNTLLAATLAVYERGLMVSVKKDLSPMMLNFYKVLFSMPFVLVLQLTFEGGVGRCFELLQPARRWTATIVLCSAILGFGVGTLVTCLISQVAGTTVQTANLFYKFVTTVLSRFTHPAEVDLQGWAGYGICTIGFCMYTFAPKPVEPVPPKHEKVN